MNNLKHIDELIEKFLDGRTTNVEERELYDWFATADVPEEWAELKAMFAWYAQGMPEDTTSESRQTAPRGVVLRRVAYTVASIAAVVVIAVMLWPSATSTHKSIYEGSYIVQNGTRYDNIDNIEQDIERVLYLADELEARADELLAWAEI